MSEHVRESESGRVETTVLGFPRIGRDRHLTSTLRRAVSRQMAELGLPALPTATIGSFPQADELRQARRRRRAGEIGAARYEAIVANAIRDAIARQEELGLDVLVPGVRDRNDMVEYFAEHLAGCAVTCHG